LCVRVFNER